MLATDALLHYRRGMDELALARRRIRLRAGFVADEKNRIQKGRGRNTRRPFLFVSRAAGHERTHKASAQEGSAMLQPTEREFEELTRQAYNLIPVAREIAADLETPVSAYLKIARGDYSFLLESVRGGEKWGRYTFLGTEPAMVIRARDGQMDLIRPSVVGPEGVGSIESHAVDNCFEALRAELKKFRAPELAGLPRFFGGAVGFLAYDLVRLFEPRIPNSVRDDLGVPELYLMFTDTVLVFDNVRQTLKIIANIALDHFNSVVAAYTFANQKIEQMRERLRSSPSQPALASVLPNQNHAGFQVASHSRPDHFEDIAISSNMTREDYVSMVRAAKAYI